MNLTQLKDLASILGMKKAARTIRDLMSGPLVRRYAHGSSSEARLAACARMSTPCLLRRVARGRWSRTSRRAAVRILMERDAQGARV